MTSTHPNGPNAPTDLLLWLVRNASSLTEEKREEYLATLGRSEADECRTLGEELRRLCEAEIQLREKEMEQLQALLTEATRKH